MSVDYFLIFLLIITLIIFYGGQNKIDKITYNDTFFYCTKNLQIFNSILKNDNFLNRINSSKNLYKNTIFQENISLENNQINFVYDIDENHPCFKGLFPNLSEIFFINLLPFNYFNVFDYFDNKKNLLMATYTNNCTNSLKLVVKNDSKNIYFIDVEKNKMISNPYIIYNFSPENTKFILLFFSKPYWFY